MSKVKYLLGFLMCSLLFMTSVYADDSTKTVNNETELKEAINNADVKTIELGSDIDITETIVVMSEKTIDGKNHTITYKGLFKGGVSDNTVWGNNTNGRGVYIIQVYNTSATIKDIKLTGGNAGLLINGSNVELKGTIDVSGNGFGGIELGQGSGVTNTPAVALNDVKLVNTTETSDKPTLWIDTTPEVAEKISVTVNGEKLATSIVDGKVNVYLDETKSPDYEEPTKEEENKNQTTDNTAKNEIENPETFDNIIIYMIIAFLGIGLLIYGINKYAKQI